MKNLEYSFFPNSRKLEFPILVIFNKPLRNLLANGIKRFYSVEIVVEKPVGDQDKTDMNPILFRSQRGVKISKARTIH